MRLALLFTLILALVSIAPLSHANDKPGDVYCFAEYSAGLPFFSFKAKCSQGRAYEKNTHQIMPSDKELVELQTRLVAAMKSDGYEVLESFRGGQVLVLGKPPRPHGKDEKEYCIITAAKTGFFANDKYPYSRIYPGEVLDCSEGTDLDLEDQKVDSATELMEQTGFKKVSQFGPVSLFER